MSEQLISLEQAGRNMLSAAAYLAQSIKSSDGHAEAMKGVVPRYLERNDVDLAAELANSIDDPFTRDRLLIQVAEKCAGIGDEEYGLQLADAIEDVGMRSQARERIAIRKAMAGEFEKAAGIAEEIIHADYVYAEIAAGLSKAGREQESAETIGKIELPVAKASAMQAIAAWNLSEGNSERAVASLDGAAAAANEIEHGEEKIRALGEIANSYIDTGRNDLAVATFEDARDYAETIGGTHRDLFLSAIAIGLLKAGNIELADATLDIVSDRTQIASGLLGFAREFWESGEKDEAMEALEESYSITKSQRETEIRDSRAANSLMGLIAAQFALFGKSERAIEIAQENRDDSEKVNTLARIAQISTLEGDSDAARQAIRAIGDESQRVFALIGVAATNARLGDNEKAVSALDQAVDLAADLPQPLSRASTFETAAAHYHEYGSPEKAREMCGRALDAITTIRSDSSRVFALAALSETFEQIGAEFGETERSAVAAMLRQADW